MEKKLFKNKKVKTVKTIDILNNLVEINNHRIKVYHTASRETDDPELLYFFVQFIRISEKCIQELSNEIFRLGGRCIQETKINGYCTWMDIKLRVTGNDRISLLKSCMYGKEHALETYEMVLKDDREYLSDDQLTLVSSQFARIRADHISLQSIIEEQKV